MGKNILRQLPASMLRFSAYQISEARSASQAIEKAALAKPSLILLDLSLPDMNGIDVARAIKKNRVTTDVPIIACSAYSIEEEEEELAAQGALSTCKSRYPPL